MLVPVSRTSSSQRSPALDTGLSGSLQQIVKTAEKRKDQAAKSRVLCGSLTTENS